ncbi:MAG: ABC transporter substrate-binding protein [Deferrisomatales bacterium]|nr:ABC transporter substrate-binding protein [Deferrisomatales bacterium]
MWAKTVGIALLGFWLGSLCGAGLTLAAEPIVLGVPTSLGFLEGKEGLNAVNLAVEEINAKGGVAVGGKKRPFRVEAIDARGAEPGVPVSDVILAHEKLILEKGAKFIVFGSFRSEAAIAAMDTVAKHKVPMLLGTAMSPAIQGKVKEDYAKYKYTFRVCLNAIYLVKYLAGTMDFLKEQYGFDKVFVMHQDVAWARGTIGATIKNYFEPKGWTVTGVEAYPTGASDFSPGLMKAKATGAQVILPIFDMPQSGILVKQWNSMRVPALLAGFISPLAGPGAWQTFDGKIGGAINVIFELGSSVSSAKVPASVAFSQAYEKRWGAPIEAGHSPAPAYEMVYLLAEAIERAGTIDSDAVVAQLEKSDRQGAMGRIRFSDDHQVVYGFDPAEEAVAAVTQWREGKRVVVFPPSLAEAAIELPEGLKSAK